MKTSKYLIVGEVALIFIVVAILIFIKRSSSDTSDTPTTTSYEIGIPSDSLKTLNIRYASAEHRELTANAEELNDRGLRINRIAIVGDSTASTTTVALSDTMYWNLSVDTFGNGATLSIARNEKSNESRITSPTVIVRVPIDVELEKIGIEVSVDNGLNLENIKSEWLTLTAGYDIEFHNCQIENLGIVSNAISRNKNLKFYESNISELVVLPCVSNLAIYGPTSTIDTVLWADSSTPSESVKASLAIGELKTPSNIIFDGTLRDDEGEKLRIRNLQSLTTIKPQKGNAL